MNSDILIIGAGVIGLMTALECRRAGATVTLLDKSATGREASWAGGGILSPLYPWRENDAVVALHRWSVQQYSLLASELLEATAIDVELNQCGMLIAAVDDQQLAESKLLDQKIEFQWVDNNVLTVSHPGLNLATNRSLLLPTIAQIRNPCLLKSLKKLLIQQNVTILEQHQVTQFNFTKSGDYIDSVQTSEGRFSADNIVLTAGAWTQQLWPNINADAAIPIIPVKGQMLLLKTSVGSIPSIVLQNNQYIVPRNDGHLLVGSTVEHAGFNKVNTVSARRQLKQFFDHLYPALNHLPVIKHWAGIRPGSNRSPIICRHTNIENLYINSGHFRNGLNLAPASARLVVDLIADREPIVPVQPYQLS
jgi:glycine oxidase